jgi:hypothetical protein
MINKESKENEKLSDKPAGTKETRFELNVKLHFASVIKEV